MIHSFALSLLLPKKLIFRRRCIPSCVKLAAIFFYLTVVRVLTTNLNSINQTSDIVPLR
jgi:hypothetical protein